MYQEIDKKVSFQERERGVLQTWKANKTFERSVKLHEKEHIFYDGPPFPTGNPHHGTVFVSILKDSIARFFTMNGYSVPRKWGWDCHGLPIENAVEKKLGIKNKAEIENGVGVAHFNQECRAFVSGANDAWETYINKIGRWTEYENSYRTMNTDFMESVLWVFKESHKKDLIYKDYRVTPYCYQCETSLSISDTRESDSTRPRQDPTIVVKFKASQRIAGMDTYYLAWTTTPWTLTSNLALAVGDDFEYVAIEHEGTAVVMAKALLGKYKKELGAEPTIIQSLSGKDLVGEKYEPLMPYFKEADSEGCFRILSGDFVSLDDGVGIVHLAPAFGEDDYWLCKRNGIGVKNPVDAAGCFTADVVDFVGENVHVANKDIIKFLKDRQAVFRHETIEHNYPHCWRCRTPLIYRAMDAWYFSVEKIKANLIKNNNSINWVPETVKYGRFGNWLEGARDWNISRSRYWGTPIPVWECEAGDCDHIEVLGSLAEIEAKTGQRPEDLHKEFLDPLKVSCPKCDCTMARVPEVLDCWFESGSMPYGQCHYPFENKDWFEEHFPCDYIVEYPGQIRGWFYYLHVLSTALFDRPAFRNCVVHGTLLSADGTKISKSKKNYTDPMELIDTYGADAMRIYLLSSPAAAMGDMNFKDEGIKDQIRDVLLPLLNAYSFFATYANMDSFQADPDVIPAPKGHLDRWVLACLHRCEKQVQMAFSHYHLNKTLNPVLDFIECVTNWYIRQSRERFWAPGMSDDKKEAYETLYYVLTALTKMLAPSAPFISESFYQRLTGKESVHLDSWPTIPEEFANEELIDETGVARLIANLGLSLRQKVKVKVRQPLAKVSIALPKNMSEQQLAGHVDVIKSELNVKMVEFIRDPSNLGTVRAVPNSRVLGRRFGKDMQKIIKGAKEGNIREDGESVVVSMGGESWTIEKENITIGYEGKEGLDVVSNQGVVLAMDFKITPELKEEGIANDLNRVIQNMRKDMDYQISDKIQLSLKGELGDQWKAYLLESSLGEKAVLSEDHADMSKTVSFEGRQFEIKIKRL